MAIDKHGLKIIGLRKASGDTKDYGICSGRYHEVFYDKASGEVWTVFQYSLGHNSWTEYPYPYDEVIKVCETSRHMTMQEIADAIYKRLERLGIEEVQIKTTP